MALFPMFVDLKGRDCLVIGAGEVALRKIEQLVKFAPDIVVIAPETHPEIRTLAGEYPITLLERGYTLDDCNGRFLVIGALDDYAHQKKIYHRCMEMKIPVNCVDSPELCSFIFPALIVEGDLCVGINTAGRAPAVSSALRQYIQKIIPSKISALIDEVDAIRRSRPAGQERQRTIIEHCRKFFEGLK